MTAKEVLKRYAAGERDFCSRNLRGQSFKGQDLSGADFSGADIRGTNFTEANLTGAKFVKAEAGLPKRWVITLLFVCLVFLVFSSFWAIIFGSLMGYIISVKPQLAAVGWISLILWLAFNFFWFYRGISGLTFTTAFISAITVVFCFAWIKTIPLASAIYIVFGFALSMTSAIAFAFPFVFTNIIISITIIIIAFAFTYPILNALISPGTSTITIAFNFGFGFIFIMLYSCLGWRAIKGDPKDVWIRTMAVAAKATGGTSFRYANLTYTDFTEATLKNTDFRNAKLIRTCFKQTKKLDFARLGKTYLNIPQVRELVIKGQGQDKDFSRLNLQGINLQGANLADTNFISADLSNANLQDADLSRAKLVQTLLDKTDFTGATLTGAYIEDWGITRETKLDGVRCEYVYMQLPTKDNPDPFRKPDNNKEVFVDGEFGEFIKPIVDTLDLYHNQNVDPRAIAIAFRQLAENHPDAELEIVAIEKRGTGNFLLRAATSLKANRSALSKEYFANYNKLKVLNQKSKARIAEQDKRIMSLERMVEMALQKPSFYYDRSNIGIAHISGGTIEGGAKVAGVINEAEQRNLAETAKEIQQLLEQLDKSYSTDTTASKMAIATEAIKQIESNPTLLARLMSALKAGSVSALESALNHPAASFLIAALQDLQETGKAEH